MIDTMSASALSVCQRFSECREACVVQPRRHITRLTKDSRTLVVCMVANSKAQPHNGGVGEGLDSSSTSTKETNIHPFSMCSISKHHSLEDHNVSQNRLESSKKTTTPASQTSITGQTCVIPKRTQNGVGGIIPACPVCGGNLIEIRAKLQCERCHRICETCCEGGRG